jgi:Zn-dependent oligopeptidase
LDEERVREYFPLSHVIAEMLKIFERVLGLKFKRVDGAWERKLVWHEDAQLWEVWNEASSGGKAWFESTNITRRSELIYA